MTCPRWHDEDTAFWLDDEGHQIGIVEITYRANDGQMVMTPTRRNNELFLGVVGLAQQRYGFNVYALGPMTNHGSYLISVRSAVQQSHIMQFIHSNLALEVGNHGDHGVHSRRRTRRRGKRIMVIEPFRKRARFINRGKPIAVTTESRAVERLKYVLSNGTKEGMVRSPQDSVHANSGPALHAGHRTQRGVWVDRTKLAALRKKHGKDYPESAATTVFTIRLSKLPFLRHLSDDEYRDFCRRLCDEIVDEAKETLGPNHQYPSAYSLRNMDPRICVPLERKRAPVVHSDEPEQEAEYRARRATMWEAFQVAHHDLKASLREGRPFRGTFPPGCIRPTDRLKD